MERESFIAPRASLFSSEAAAYGSLTDVDNSESVREGLSFPGLTEWLEKLRLDPTTPRFESEPISHRSLPNLISLETGATEPQSDEPLGPLALDAGLLRRRKEFWRTQPVRTFVHGETWKAQHLSVGETRPADFRKLRVQPSV